MLRDIIIACIRFFFGWPPDIPCSYSFRFLYYGFDVIQLFLVLLAVFIFFRESYAVFGGGAANGLLTAAFLLYSAFSVAAFGSSLFGSISEKDIYWFCLFSSILAFVAVLIGGGGPLSVGVVDRSSGLFNNPNQLGYFAVCIFSIACFLFFLDAIPQVKVWSLVGLSLCLSAASLSKASMISVGAGIFFLLLFQSRKRTGFLATSLIASSIFIAVLVPLSENTLSEYSAVKRLQNIGADTDDSLMERGYGALADANALELFIGLGHEKTMRIVKHEVHSTIFSFFITYGLIGGVLFSAVIGFWFYRVWRFSGFPGLIIICMPPMLYGVTHNGSRFTIFWLLIALSFHFSRMVLSSNSEPVNKEMRRGSSVHGET